MVVQTDWENDEAVLYLQHRFERIGLDEKLAKHGAKQGDEVRILGFAFSFDGDASTDGPDPADVELEDDEDLEQDLDVPFEAEEEL
jgi:GTP-binding protein